MLEENKTYDKLYEEPKYNHINGNFYAIFRVGTRYKDMIQIQGFQKHMEREIDVKNANKDIKNELLIGNKEVVKTVKEYLKDTKIRKDNVIATELLLTASHGFFNAPKQEIDRWVNLNKEWLKREFKENCVYATLHKDEYSYHIHALIVPRFKNKKNENILANTRYFKGGKARMTEWQDNYCNEMQNTFKSLKRGIKGSKAKHMQIKKWYSLINENYNELSREQLIARAKQAELLELKIKGLSKTLESYKKQLEAEKNKKLVKEEIKVKERVLERAR